MQGVSLCQGRDVKLLSSEEWVDLGVGGNIIDFKINNLSDLQYVQTANAIVTIK